LRVLAAREQETLTRRVMAVDDDGGLSAELEVSAPVEVAEGDVDRSGQVQFTLRVRPEHFDELGPEPAVPVPRHGR
jgi:hypothetical protein